MTRVKHSHSECNSWLIKTFPIHHFLKHRRVLLYSCRCTSRVVNPVLSREAASSVPFRHAINAKIQHGDSDIVSRIQTIPVHCQRIHRRGSPGFLFPLIGVDHPQWRVASPSIPHIDDGVSGSARGDDRRGRVGRGRARAIDGVVQRIFHLQDAIFGGSQVPNA